jgi:hypothetical protein
MTHPRHALLVAALLTLPAGLVTAGTPADQAEYLGGTLKSIPANTVGALDLNNPKEFIFTYGKTVYRLPYSQIQTYSFESKPARRVLGRFPMPRLALHKRNDILNLTYRDGVESGTLSFQLNGKELVNADSILAERVDTRRKPDQAVAQAESTIYLPAHPEPASWWGDHVWRTNRNKAAWPSTDTPSTTVAVGSK